jgi:hypothetical protein
MITISEAIKTINPEAEFSCTDNDISSIKWLNNTTPISSDDITSKQNELENDYTAKQYQRDRAKEYPLLTEQIDYIYHNGIEAWKTDMINPVKNKYPKGSE